MKLYDKHFSFMDVNPGTALNRKFDKFEKSLQISSITLKNTL